jgi:predicted Zn-dependent protease
MPNFEPKDKHHFEAAQGWLELGNWVEANEELESLSFKVKVHPEVLAIRFQIYAKAGKWEYAAEIARSISELLPDNPFGAFHLAYSLHVLKRTREAWNVLIPVVDKFPSEHLIRYNLACYACQLGNRTEAFEWLQKAIDLAGKDDIRMMALEDPDLEPIWIDISEI